MKRGRTFLPSVHYTVAILAVNIRNVKYICTKFRKRTGEIMQQEQTRQESR